MARLPDIASHLLADEYCNKHLKGKPTMKKTKQSLSCFDQTLPVSVNRRAGSHQICWLTEKQLPYWSCTSEYKHKIPKKYPYDFTRKGDGEKIKKRELARSPPPAEPPEAGAQKMRDNPPNTLFRKLYERGDLPLQVEHGSAKNTLIWKQDINKMDYHHFLPLFFDGIREKEEPYRFIAVKGCEDLLKVGEGKILPVVPQLIIPIKTALNTRDPAVMNIALQLIMKLVDSEKEVGQSLVPYYRQLLPVLNIFKNSIPNIGDKIDYAQQKNECTGELVHRTLELLEKRGGQDAFINIKYMVPSYESCLLG